MKICLLNYDGMPTVTGAVCRRVGGLNVSLFHLAKSLAQLPETNVSVVFRREANEVERIENVALIGIPAGPTEILGREELEAYLPEFTDNLRKYLQDTNPDIIHTSGSEAGYVMSELRKGGIAIPWVHTNYATLAARRVVAFGQSKTKATSDSMGKRELLCLDECDLVLSYSGVDRNEIHRIFDIPLSKIAKITKGVDPLIFKPPSDNYPRENIIVSAGRMAEIKDHPFLLRVFQQVYDMYTQSKNLNLLLIGGNSTERDKLGLSKLAHKLDILERIKFIDGVPQKQLVPYLGSAKVFAGTSRHETFGMLPVEARACGTPFVVRANSSYLETAKDGFGGWLADNSDESDMAYKINHILTLSETEWEKMSSDAVKSIRSFSWSVCAKECYELYKSVLHNS